MNVVLCGAPGSGKGTVGQRLADELALRRIVTGDLLREHVAKGTELGRKARSYMEAGDLVPDELLFRIVEEAIRGDAKEGGFLTDGYPRSTGQAEHLLGYLEKKGLPKPLVVLLKVDAELVVQRLEARRQCRNSACGAIYNLRTKPPATAGVCDVCGGPLVQRPDDREDVIRNRLREYYEKTAPMMEVLKDGNPYREIDGAGSPNEVYGRLLAAVKGD